MNLRVEPSNHPDDIGRDYEKSLSFLSRVTSGPTAGNSTPAVETKDEKIGRSKDKSISILLIEDNRLFRIGLSGLLRKQKGLKLLASSARPDVIPQLGPWRRPDVILLDLGLGDRGSIQVVRGIREASPDARLIAMGLIPVKSEILGLVKEGVSGFILKDASITDFVAAIRAVAAGQKVFPSSLTDSLFSQILEDATRKGSVDVDDVKMSIREREIIDLITEGMSNKEIAKKLSIATDTVKSHVHNILEKLSLHSRVQVAARGRARASTVR
jgi:two-component system nitrate/nitrite response regulator NarL